jgi:site-specific DNA recombinase
MGMTMHEKQNPEVSKAVIYCRVSSAKQTVRGDGLASQETRCREFAKLQRL